MIKIGELEVHGRGKRYRSRRDFKTGIREFAGILGLRIRFVTRKKLSDTDGWCDVHQGRAIVCEGRPNRLFLLEQVVGVTLHELAHWIQFNEGLFKDFYGKSRYGGVDPNTLDREKFKRIAFRAERHADWTARRLAQELYGTSLPKYESIYDHPQEAKIFLNVFFDNIWPNPEGSNEFPTNSSSPQRVPRSRLRRAR